MNCIYIVLDKNTITITRRRPACGVAFRWEEENLTTENLRKLQSKYPDHLITIPESLIGLIQANDEAAAAMPITRGEEKPFSPNSNRLKFDLKEVGKKTYSERETKPQQDHIARHNAPLPTNRDRVTANNKAETLPEYHYTKILREHKSEILQNSDLQKALCRAVAAVVAKEDGCSCFFTSELDRALQNVFPDFWKDND